MSRTDNAPLSVFPDQQHQHHLEYKSLAPTHMNALQQNRIQKEKKVKRIERDKDSRKKERSVAYSVLIQIKTTHRAVEKGLRKTTTSRD